MNSVPWKMTAKNEPHSSTDTPIAAVSVRWRKIDSGISGTRARDSTTAKPASSTAPAARKPTTVADPQPASTLLLMAYTTAMRPAVTVTAPAKSIDLSVACGETGMTAITSAANATPTGTLMKNTHSQPGPLVSAPPAITPIEAALPPTAPKMPSALLRAAPSGNVAVTIFWGA